MARSGEAIVRKMRDADEAARAAWLHFIGGLTQAEVAKRLSIPNTRAHRHIARAQSEGLVRVFVDIESAECVALETRLARNFGLSFCRVAMDVPEVGPLPLRALSAVGADFLMQTIADGSHRVIGIGHGRTLAASVSAMARIEAKDVKFVSMLGGLTRSFAANPYDVIHRIADRTGADAYLMPAPLFADTPEDKQMMTGQSGVAATMDLMERVSLVVLGIGDLDASSGAAAVAALRGPENVQRLYDLGARAELLGQFLDSNGQIMRTEYDSRVMAPALETLRGREIVAIAGGRCKAEAIAAALGSGLLTGLIVDETTARRLLEQPRAELEAAE